MLMSISILMDPASSTCPVISSTSFPGRFEPSIHIDCYFEGLSMATRSVLPGQSCGPYRLYFTNPVLDTAQFVQSMGRTQNLKTPDEAHVLFSKIVLCPGSHSHRRHEHPLII